MEMRCNMLELKIFTENIQMFKNERIQLKKRQLFHLRLLDKRLAMANLALHTLLTIQHTLKG